MSSLGVHFALAENEASHLRSLNDDEDRLSYVSEELEKLYFDQLPELKADSDKAWDAMHRALADGKLTWDGGEYPLNHAILAGEILYSGDDYIMSLKSPAQVRDIATALATLSESDFRRRYFEIDLESYGAPLCESDFLYTWDGLLCIRELYLRAARESRYVLFTADQ